MNQMIPTSRARPALMLLRAAILLSPLVLVACGNPGANGPGSGFAVRPAPAQSGLGSFLAGRFARSERDIPAAAEFFLQALADDPSNPVLLRRTFLLVLADGRMSKASELAESVIRLEPEDGIAHLVLAARAMKEGRHRDAVTRITEAPNVGLNALLGPLMAAWGEAAQGHADAALDRIRTLAETAAYRPFHDFHLALVNEFLGRFEAADAAYGKLAAPPAGAALRVVDAYGRFLERRGRREDASALYADYLKRHPESPAIGAGLERISAARPAQPPPLVGDPAAGVAEAFYGAAAILSRDDAGEATEVYLQLALYLRPQFPAARMLHADAFEARKDWPRALEIYRRIEADSEYWAMAQVRAAWALHRLEKTDEAIAVLRALAERHAGQTEALVTIGDILRGKERYADAAQEYGLALARVKTPEERHWTIFYARGIAFERSKQWPKAEADFKKALELKPEQPLVLNYLGYSWIDQGVQLEEARRMVQRAVELRPNDGYIVDSLGWALYRLGQFGEAVRQLERAVELRPDDPVINDHLGDAYWRVGRIEEARFQWRRALNLKPEAELEPKIRSKIEIGLDRGTGLVAAPPAGGG